jgi:hypothetical protein
MMIDKDNQYGIDLPHSIHQQISGLYENNWYVERAWKVISISDIQGVISSIKSNLLNFLLELTQEIGEDARVNIMEHKKRIDHLFDQTIGNISGGNIHITIGNDNLQSVNYGERASINVAKGDNINQSINGEALKELSKFVAELKTIIDRFALSTDDKADLLAEISRLEIQLQREKPKHSIISGALNTINGILIGVAGNAMTQPILDQLEFLIGRFSGG